MIQVSLDYTLLFQIIQFLLVVLITNFLILKPIKKLIDNRDARINDINLTANHLVADVEVSRQNYEEKLADVKKEIATYNDKVRSNSLKTVEGILGNAKAEISADNVKAMKDIELAAKDAKKELDKELKKLSESIYKQLSA